MKYSNIARKVVKHEISSLTSLADHFPADFDKFIDYVLKIKGRVVLVGIGKSGHIAKKIAASLASTGTTAFFVHPSEASHGDLGMLQRGDIAIILSNSGETAELRDTIDYCKKFNIKIAAMTMRADSLLGRNADFLLLLPKVKEASNINSPIDSAIMMLALGDSITVTLHDIIGFSKEQYRQFHPGGKIGANLLKVSDLMYEGEKLPIVSEKTMFNQVIITMTQKSFGCAFVINNEREVIGIITDGDLRRHVNDNQLHLKNAKEIMTPRPEYIEPEKLAKDALLIMNRLSITALAVLDNANKLIGLIHIHDILRAGIGCQPD